MPLKYFFFKNGCLTDALAALEMPLYVISVHFPSPFSPSLRSKSCRLRWTKLERGVGCWRVRWRRPRRNLKKTKIRTPEINRIDYCACRNWKRLSGTRNWKWRWVNESSCIIYQLHNTKDGVNAFSLATPSFTVCQLNRFLFSAFKKAMRGRKKNCPIWTSNSTVWRRDYALLTLKCRLVHVEIAS